MSYHILPRNNNIININPIITKSTIPIYTSFSLYNNYINIKNELDMFIKNDSENTKYVENLLKNINPYEYIYSIVPGLNCSVSKLKTNSNAFYDLLEIFHTLNINSFLKEIYESINLLVISPNYNDIEKCIKNIRDNPNDKINSSYKSNNLLDNNDNFRSCHNAFDLIYLDICEITPLLKVITINENDNSLEDVNVDNLNSYIMKLIECLKIILKHQLVDGCCIIKIGYIFHKPVVDIFYILSSLFEKTYIIKPNTSNIISFEKYIVCKQFIFDNDKINIYEKYYDILNKYSKNKHTIMSIIDEETPVYFINKIDDINNITGQEQLESMDHVINFIKNKNVFNESQRKTNIQKSINWCEKYKIPCNKFTEKTNIFLPVFQKTVT